MNGTKSSKGFWKVPWNRLGEGMILRLISGIPKTDSLNPQTEQAGARRRMTSAMTSSGVMRGRSPWPSLADGPIHCPKPLGEDPISFLSHTAMGCHSDRIGVRYPPPDPYLRWDVDNLQLGWMKPSYIPSSKGSLLEDLVPFAEAFHLELPWC